MVGRNGRRRSGGSLSREGQGKGAPCPDRDDPSPGSAGAGSTSPFGRGGRLVGLAALLLTAACAPQFPPIAERGGDAAFKASIAENYQPGRRGADLRAELLREGFTLLADPAAGRYSGLFEPGNLPCFTSVRIDWTEDRRGRIALIQAQRHPCS